jgi:hypothetical protein
MHRIKHKFSTILENILKKKTKHNFLINVSQKTKFSKFSKILEFSNSRKIPEILENQILI